MRLFGRSFGGGRLLGRARAAELRGELADASALFAQAGRPDDAARVMVLRGDGELESRARLTHYVQAIAMAPEGSPTRDHARRKRASLILSIAAQQGATPALRQDLLEAARDLESLGEHGQAAEAFERLGDVEGEARNLARAGDIDKLDALLSTAQERDRSALARRHSHEEIETLTASGRRREALAVAMRSSDEALRERGKSLESRRIRGDVVVVTLHGARLPVVLGTEVTIGRSATLSVASAAVSRAHVVVARRGHDVVVRDLGSRNGTLLRGLALAGEALVADGIEVRMGKEVSLCVRPASELAGAVSIEVAGTRYLAPLGPARLGIGAWRLEQASDRWIELVTDDDPPAFSGALRLASHVTLLAGDTFTNERSALPLLAVEAAP